MAWKIQKGAKRTDNPNIRQGVVYYEDDVTGEIILTKEIRIDATDQAALDAEKATLLQELADKQAQIEADNTLRTNLEAFLNS